MSGEPRRRCRPSMSFDTRGRLRNDAGSNDPGRRARSTAARGGSAARQRRAVARRLGWDGGGPATLADAGAANGYTRERVRQLEERVVDRVGAARPELPVTRAALTVVRDAAPATHAEVADLLAE